MPSGKKRKRHKMATHKRKKTLKEKQTQEEITFNEVLQFYNIISQTILCYKIYHLKVLHQLSPVNIIGFSVM